MKYRALDLFCGLKGFSQAMIEDPKWKVLTIDFKKEFNPDICIDISKLSYEILDGIDYDLILASPPCTCFSMASMSHYWDKIDGKFVPKRERNDDGDILVETISKKGRKAKKHLNLVKHSIDLIKKIEPKYWFMENPKAMLSPILKQELGIEPKGYVTYCQYGEDRMKPTHLWGKHPPNFKFKHCSYGDPCHKSTPRGSKNGTQGLTNAKIRAKVPYELSKSIKKSVENPRIPSLDDF